MNALAELKKRASTNAANRANTANLGPRKAAGSQESHDSLRVKVGKHLSVSRSSAPAGLPRYPLKELRVQLLALATANRIGLGHVHKLHNADLAPCIGLDASQLATYLSMLTDTAHRHAGRVPGSDTAAIKCERCGPVWVHPSIAEMLPVVGGWPRALGCPWCFVRTAGGHFPRPYSPTKDSQ